MTFYFTFGQSHAHRSGNVTLDKDCVVEIEAESSEEARKIMFDTFGQKWSNQYDEKPDMSYYQRGIFKI